ncbi:hypothetical protein K438DRAFT_1998046 [Mycena galopus ATCC 62051]|nr:hypothetical protein K438DRAFT_1998046 [Mycena galopus ATCC 62051]
MPPHALLPACAAPCSSMPRLAGPPPAITPSRLLPFALALPAVAAVLVDDNIVLQVAQHQAPRLCFSLTQRLRARADFTFIFTPASPSTSLPVRASPSPTRTPSFCTPTPLTPPSRVSAHSPRTPIYHYDALLVIPPRTDDRRRGGWGVWRSERHRASPVHDLRSFTPPSPHGWGLPTVHQVPPFSAAFALIPGPPPPRSTAGLIKDTRYRRFVFHSAAQPLARTLLDLTLHSHRPAHRRSGRRCPPLLWRSEAPRRLCASSACALFDDEDSAVEPPPPPRTLGLTSFVSGAPPPPHRRRFTSTHQLHPPTHTPSSCPPTPCIPPSRASVSPPHTLLRHHYALVVPPRPDEREIDDNVEIECAPPPVPNVAAIRLALALSRVFINNALCHFLDIYLPQDLTVCVHQPPLHPIRHQIRHTVLQARTTRSAGERAVEQGRGRGGRGGAMLGREIVPDEAPSCPTFQGHRRGILAGKEWVLAELCGRRMHGGGGDGCGGV